MGVLVLVWQWGLGSHLVWGVPATGGDRLRPPHGVRLLVRPVHGLRSLHRLADAGGPRCWGLDRPRRGERHGPHGQAVTSAALVLVLAFAALAASPSVPLKMFATGLGRASSLTPPSCGGCCCRPWCRSWATGPGGPHDARLPAALAPLALVLPQEPDLVRLEPFRPGQLHRLRNRHQGYQRSRVATHIRRKGGAFGRIRYVGDERRPVLARFGDAWLARRIAGITGGSARPLDSPHKENSVKQTTRCAEGSEATSMSVEPENALGDYVVGNVRGHLLYMICPRQVAEPDLVGGTVEGQLNAT